MKSFQPRGLLHVVLLICAGLFSSVTFAQSYLVSVDTSSIAGSNGYVDFQFNPADLTAPAAEASILQWIGNVTLLDAPLVEGDVTGVLPGTVSLGNGTAFNDYFQAAAFGNSFSLVLNFDSSAAPSSLLGTSFALALYAADGTTPLLSDDLSGSILRFELLGDGIDSISSSAVQVAPVPLPAAAWLFLSGIAGVFGVRRSRSKLSA